MDSLEELGRKAYQKQIWGDYIGAITIYTTAIKKYPKDPRPLNNRCLCYIEMKEFKKAMEDADLMIRLFPKHTKSYYRKGEILAALKRYIEAEESYSKVLSLDPECEDAKRALLDVQAMQLCGLGYKKDHALKALNLTINSITHCANVEDAENILKYGAFEKPSQSSSMDDDIIYYSDDENGCNIIKQDTSEYDPRTDPSNPLKSCSLWVGFITELVTKKELEDLFSKYGKIVSVCIYVTTHCAFINYTDHIAPGKAMKALQGTFIGGKHILIRYPDSAVNATSKRTKAM